MFGSGIGKEKLTIEGALFVYNLTCLRKDRLNYGGAVEQRDNAEIGSQHLRDACMASTAEQQLHLQRRKGFSGVLGMDESCER